MSSDGTAKCGISFLNSCNYNIKVLSMPEKGIYFILQDGF